jgi:ABC-type Fe3+ transport system substrate-binding protein
VNLVNHASTRWRRRVLPCVAAATLTLAIAACGSSSGAATPAAGTAAHPIVYSDETSMVAAAKKEGTVNVYMAPEFTPFLAKGFMQKYPWAKVNVTGLEPPAAAAKWATEVGAGVKNVDVASIYITQVKQFTDQNAISAVQLPNDNLIAAPLQDANHYFHASIEYPYVLLYNTKELPNGGPADLKDLTLPQWKGKLVMDNPALGGPGGLTMAAMQEEIGASGWQQYLTALKANDPDLTDSSSASYDAVVRGDRPLCICSYHDFVGQAAGTPVGVDFYNQSTTGVIPQAGTMVVAAKAPHPAMAALWINWVLSATGGQAAVAASGRTPVVANVPGADKVDVPAGTKVASFDILRAYLNDPDQFNTVYKSTFGS